MDDDRLSDEERKAFAELRQEAKECQRNMVAALKEIRERRLYREDYKNFDDFMVTVGHKRQWLTQQVNWLRRTELLEKLTGKDFGKPPYQLTVEEAQKLGRLEPDYDDDECDHELHAQLMVDALIEAQQAAESIGRPRTVDMTKEAVEKRVCLLKHRSVYGETLTLDESVQISRLEGYADQDIEEYLAVARSEAKTKEAVADVLKAKIDDLLEKDALMKEEQKLLAEKEEANRKVSAHQNRWLVLVEGWEISGATAVGGGAVCVFDAGGRCGLLFP